MAIDVNRANGQANSINGNIDELRRAKSHLVAYRNELNNAWQSNEVSFYNNAINDAISKIDRLIAEMQGLSNDIRNTASQIKREEEAAAAAAAAAAARNNRIKAAQAEYDKAKKKLDELNKEKEKLEEKMKKSFFERITKKDDLEELIKKIEQAQKTLASKRSALNAAKR